MEWLAQDVRYTLRALRRSPLFAFTVILTLAIGIGANTAIFSFVDRLLLRPLPYGEPAQLVAIWEDFSATGGPEQEWFTPPDVVDVREQARTLSSVSLYSGWNPNRTGSGEPERLTGALVSASYFTLLGVPPLLGRSFTEEDATDEGRVVVISHGLWQRSFGGDPSVLGSTILLNDAPYTVLGVMPPGFSPPLQQAEIWRPATPTTFSAGCGRSCYVTRVIGRLGPGVTLAQARAELASLGESIAASFPEDKQGFTFRVVPLQEQITGPVQPALLALMGAVGLLLLIACVNIANLLLARAGGREREVAVRVAIGAGRRALMRQLLAESVLLGLIGGTAGVVLAFWAVDLLVAMSPPTTPRLEEVAVDARVLGFAAALSVLTGLLFGLVPSLQLSRPGVIQVLREGGARSSAARNRLRSALVVCEVALALMLLAGAGLLMRSFLNLQAVDPGFDAANLLTVNLLPPSSRYEGPPQINAFYDELLDRLSRRPGVRAAAATSVLPLAGGNTDVGFLIEGRPLPRSQAEQPVAWYRSVTPDYFRAMGMSIVRGRGITERDRGDAPAVVVVNETMAARYWPGEDPIGQRITSEGPEGPWTEVVGVVEDVRNNGIDQAPLVEMYLPLEQLPARTMAVVLRTERDPLGYVSAVRDEVRALDAQLPVASVNTMEQLVSRSVALPRLYLAFFAFFALVALVLAGLGIYGVTAYAVTQRTQEIGIRLALGARPPDVLKLIIRQNMLVVGLGLLIGMAGALALSRTLQALLFELSATDPATFVAIALMLLAVGLVATYTPARRATRVDPVVSLRTE